MTRTICNLNCLVFSPTQYSLAVHTEMSVYTILVCVYILGNTIVYTSYTRDTQDCTKARAEFEECKAK